MTPPERCDAVHEGVRCALDAGHHPGTRHAATTPTSLARWDTGADAEIVTWRRSSQPPVFKKAATCPVCETPIKPRNYRERFCSDDCRKASRRSTNRRNKINVRRRQRQKAAVGADYSGPDNKVAGAMQQTSPGMTRNP